MNDDAWFDLSIIYSDGDTTIAVLSGEVEANSCHLLARKLVDLAMGPARRIVLDSSRVTFLDRTALELLADVDTLIRANDGEFVIQEPSAAVARILHLADLDHEFDVVTE